MPDTAMRTIPGYDFGAPPAARSPLSLDELHDLEAAVGWTDDDAAALRDAGKAALIDQAEAMVDSWRAEIATQPELVKWFFGPDGKPDDTYRAAVKRRFVQWVIDSCTRPHDRAWLDYQEEIGLRHTPAKKNRTDSARTPDRVPLRYLLGFIGFVGPSAEAFLRKVGLPEADVARMQRAWSKSVLLHVTLWSRPYVRDDLW